MHNHRKLICLLPWKWCCSVKVRKDQITNIVNKTRDIIVDRINDKRLERFSHLGSREITFMDTIKNTGNNGHTAPGVKDSERLVSKKLEEATISD